MNHGSIPRNVTELQRVGGMEGQLISDFSFFETIFFRSAWRYSVEIQYIYNYNYRFNCKYLSDGPLAL